MWRQRRAKGRVTDIYVAGQRILCSECQKEHKRLKALLVAARTQGPNAPRVAELAAELKATPYLASTLHPKINTMYFERHPWLAMKLPAIITHRAAVTIEVMDEIVRSARMPLGSQTLETQYREDRTLHAARMRLVFYGLQRAMRRRTGSAQPVIHYDVGISTISDNYITSALLHFYDTHKKCSRSQLTL